MPAYDPQSLESVLLYMRQEFGASVFRDAKRMHAIICDLSPKLKPYSNIIRQLAERGALAELEAASGDKVRQERAMMKARYMLENELLMNADHAGYILGAVGTLYGIAAPNPQPAKIVKRGDCGDNVTYTLDENGVLTISGNGSMRNFEWIDFSFRMPWWDERKTITQANIQRGVTTVGEGAFDGCAALTGVTIPDSVTTIGGFAFRDCYALTSVTIPCGVTEIKESAFVDCKSLKSVNIPDSVTTIGDCAFEGCAGLTNLNIPNSVREIGALAFWACARLKSVNIPNSVTTISGGVFASCSGLTSVTIPDSVTTIGWSAFRGCTGLTSVSVPAMAQIADDAFPDSVRVTRRA